MEEIRCCEIIRCENDINQLKKHSLMKCIATKEFTNFNNFIVSFNVFDIEDGECYELSTKMFARADGQYVIDAEFVSFIQAKDYVKLHYKKLITKIRTIDVEYEQPIKIIKAGGINE